MAQRRNETQRATLDGFMSIGDAYKELQKSLDKLIDEVIGDYLRKRVFKKVMGLDKHEVLYKVGNDPWKIGLLERQETEFRREYDMCLDGIYGSLAHNCCRVNRVTEHLDISLAKVTEILPFCGAIEKVIYNPPATIVMWSDGTKTVVKCSENDEYHPMTGLLSCIVKKLEGGGNNWHRVLDRWLPC